MIAKSINFYHFYRMRLFQYMWLPWFLCLLFYGHSTAQTAQIRFDHLNSADGLSANVVNSIYQDNSGFMWFGTNDGLNRYDGYDFTIYNHTPDQENTISSNLVFTITEDHHGHIWIGTTGSGLNHYDPVKEQFTHYTHDLLDPASIGHNQILWLETDSKGRIWVGTLTGLNVILPRPSPEDAPTFIRIKMPERGPIFRVNVIKEDNGGNIWLGTRYGLFMCRNEGDPTRYSIEEVLVPNYPEIPVNDIAIDQHGRLLLGSLYGLFYQSKKGNAIDFQRFDEVGSVQSIVLDEYGTIWSGSYTGIRKFTNRDRNRPPQLLAFYTAQENNPYSLRNNVVRNLFLDRTGLIWAGTGGGGICKFDPTGKPFIHAGQNFFHNGTRYTAIRALQEDRKGNLWLGTEGGGLFWQQHNEEDETFDRFESLGLSASPFALAEVEENGRRFMYVGSEGHPSLQKFDIEGEKPIPSTSIPQTSGSIFSILQDRNGFLWIGTYNQGLYRIHIQPDGSYRSTRFSKNGPGLSRLSSDIIRKLHEDRNGNLWIGTSEGLNMIERDQTTINNPTIYIYKYSKEDQNSLSHDYILDIHENGAGKLWIGTFGGGLNEMELFMLPDSIVFTRYLERDGLSNNSVKSIEEDADGNLWLATNRGLVQFDPETKTFHNYSPQHGLQGDEFYEVASTVRSNGQLLFGGVNGFNVFYPENIQENKYPPAILFTNFLVHNTKISPGQEVDGKILLSKSITYSDQVSLKYGQNDFSVEFAALHFAAPKQNKYEYMLEGYHDHWIQTPSDKRFATFTNLPHGNYALKVKASNSDDIWSTVPAQLNIHINAPFWLSWYAYVIYVLCLVGGLWLLRRYTLISIEEKHALRLEHLEREKLEELNQMKLRFFTNISHELRTPITLIINPLEYILEKGRSVGPEKLQQQYHYMYKNAKYLLRLVNQLLDFRKLDQGSLHLRVGKGDLIQFIRETTEPFQFVANKKNINFEILCSEEYVYAFFDPEVIEKLLYNLLSNAFKFTPENGQIAVEIVEENTVNNLDKAPYVQISVRDNGPGISNSKKKKIFERFYKEDHKYQNKDGAGIGLAYTKSLVELHRGRIFLDTQNERGACFVVRIPNEKNIYLRSEIDQKQMEQFVTTSDPLEYLIADPNHSLHESSMDVSIQEREESLPLLLFVDDNADIRQFIKEGFQNDFRIITAEDGEKGFELAKSSLPDIIVSDVMMPVMDGMELCHALKTETLTSHIPVVLLTAKSTNEDQLQGLKTGADAYVVKPFILEVLKTQLLNIHLHREQLKRKYRQEILLNPKEITVTSADEVFLKRAMDIIEDHMEDSEFNVNSLVKEMYISRSKLYLKLKALTGLSTSEFIRSVRLKRAVQLLNKSNYTIKEIMYMTGFNTASYFSKCFKKQFGVVPSEYLRNQKQMEKVDA